MAQRLPRVTRLKRRVEAQTMKEIALLDRVILFADLLDDFIEWYDSGAPKAELPGLIDRAKRERQ